MTESAKRNGLSTWLNVLAIAASGLALLLERLGHTEAPAGIDPADWAKLAALSLALVTISKGAQAVAGITANRKGTVAVLEAPEPEPLEGTEVDAAAEPEATRG